jgi:transcriptional regulator NrdR family protein
MRRRRECVNKHRYTTFETVAAVSARPASNIGARTSLADVRAVFADLIYEMSEPREEAAA